MTAKPLAADKFRYRTDPARLPFETTADLPDSAVPAGQERAMRALRFGAQMREPGYNIYVSGAKGSGKHRAVLAALERLALAQKPAPDWCYVHNFADPHAPRALSFAPGGGAQFRQAMADFATGLKRGIAAAFEDNAYCARRSAIEAECARKSGTVLDMVRDAAEARGLTLVERPDGGFEFHPVRASGGADERAGTRQARHDLRGLLQEALQAVTALQQKRDGELRALDREAGEAALRELLQPLYQRFGGNGAVRDWLNGLAGDATRNLSAFQADARGQANVEPPYRRYTVNLLVDNGAWSGAPVVQVGLPTLSRLTGQVDAAAEAADAPFGFLRVRAGALHKANGGFLLVEALDLMQQDAAWDAMKRALRGGTLAIERADDRRGAGTDVRPEAIPLSLKVVLVGEPWVFDRLRTLDPDFSELFKVAAEFTNTAPRDDKNCMALLTMVATLCRRGKLRQFERSGAARLIDEASRIAGDGERISVRIGAIHDLVREANAIAGEAGRSLIAARDIERAIAAKDDRAGRTKVLEQEMIRRRLVFLETEGARAGQINALTVMKVRGDSFGQPARITASASPGTGKGVGIERMAHYRGSTRRRGAQTLAAYINRTYSPLTPLSLLATVSFEQFHGPIDGDSASAAELLAILSAIADVPLKQGIAITGAIDQSGALQPVGNINQKIEGFFDVCRMRGLNGTHGVIVPAANSVNLMLRDDVADAARKANFALYTAGTVDEAIEILTGLQAGVAKGRRGFPRSSFHRLVTDNLMEFARPRLLRPVHVDGWWHA